MSKHLPQSVASALPRPVPPQSPPPRATAAVGGRSPMSTFVAPPFSFNDGTTTTNVISDQRHHHQDHHVRDQLPTTPAPTTAEGVDNRSTSVTAVQSFSLDSGRRECGGNRDYDLLPPSPPRFPQDDPHDVLEEEGEEDDAPSPTSNLCAFQRQRHDPQQQDREESSSTSSPTTVVVKQPPPQQQQLQNSRVPSGKGSRSTAVGAVGIAVPHSSIATTTATTSKQSAQLQHAKALDEYLSTAPLPSSQRQQHAQQQQQQQQQQQVPPSGAGRSFPSVPPAGSGYAVSSSSTATTFLPSTSSSSGFSFRSNGNIAVVSHVPLHAQESGGPLTLLSRNNSGELNSASGGGGGGGAPGDAMFLRAHGSSSSSAYTQLSSSSSPRGEPNPNNNHNHSSSSVHAVVASEGTAGGAPPPGASQGLPSPPSYHRHDGRGGAHSARRRTDSPQTASSPFSQHHGERPPLASLPGATSGGGSANHNNSNVSRASSVSSVSSVRSTGGGGSGGATHLPQSTIGLGIQHPPGGGGTSFALRHQPQYHHHHHHHNNNTHLPTDYYSDSNEGSHSSNFDRGGAASGGLSPAPPAPRPSSQVGGSSSPVRGRGRGVGGFSSPSSGRPARATTGGGSSSSRRSQPLHHQQRPPPSPQQQQAAAAAGGGGSSVREDRFVAVATSFSTTICGFDGALLDVSKVVQNSGLANVVDVQDVVEDLVSMHGEPTYSGSSARGSMCSTASSSHHGGMRRVGSATSDQFRSSTSHHVQASSSSAYPHHHHHHHSSFSGQPLHAQSSGREPSSGGSPGLGGGNTTHQQQQQPPMNNSFTTAQVRLWKPNASTTIGGGPNNNNNVSPAGTAADAVMDRSFTSVASQGSSMSMASLDGVVASPAPLTAMEQKLKVSRKKRQVVTEDELASLMNE